MEVLYECDLHCHTTRSDGNVTPKELIDGAVERGLKVVAITDHDMIPPKTIEVDKQDVDIVEYAKTQGIQLLRGIEISCDTSVEDVHIIAFACDWEHPFFEELESMTISSKVQSYRELVIQLNKSGILIDWEELLYNKGNPILPKNLQKKKIFEMIANKGYADSWQDAKLMVKRSKSYNVMREKPDPRWVIQKIHETGGIAILAHPYLFTTPVFVDGKVLKRKEYIEKLVEAGLDGIEACYTYDKTSYDGDKTKEELEKEIRAESEGKLKIISGGSDYHGDEKKGVQNPRMIGECGVSFEYFNEHIAKYIIRN